MRLFERSSRGASLTPAGRLLLEHAERLLEAADAARADLAAAAEFRRGRIRMGAFATATAGFVADALPTIRTQLGVEVGVVVDEPHQAILGLVAGGIGVALVPRLAVQQGRRDDRPGPCFAMIRLHFACDLRRKTPGGAET